MRPGHLLSKLLQHQGLCLTIAQNGEDPRDVLANVASVRRADPNPWESGEMVHSMLQTFKGLLKALECAKAAAAAAEKVCSFANGIYEGKMRKIHLWSSGPGCVPASLPAPYHNTKHCSLNGAIH